MCTTTQIKHRSRNDGNTVLCGVCSFDKRLAVKMNGVNVCHDCLKFVNHRSKLEGNTPFIQLNIDTTFLNQTQMQKLSDISIVGKPPFQFTNLPDHILQLLTEDYHQDIISIILLKLKELGINNASMHNVIIDECLGMDIPPNRTNTYLVGHEGEIIARFHLRNSQPNNIAGIMSLVWEEEDTS